MKVKQLCVIIMAIFCCFLAYDYTSQNQQTNPNSPYDELEKKFPEKERQPIMRKDEVSGNRYVIPWKESDEYYGEPPPKVLDSQPQQAFPGGFDQNKNNQLPNND